MTQVATEISFTLPVNRRTSMNVMMPMPIP